MVFVYFPALPLVSYFPAQDEAGVDHAKTAKIIDRFHVTSSFYKIEN